MLDGIRKKKWIYIKDFFSKDELAILQPYCLKRSFEANDSEIFNDPQGQGTPSFDHDEIMKYIHINKLKRCEEIAKLKLFKTYSYWRGYTYGVPLHWHKDRPSCEISITACIDSDGSKWPIYMEDTPVDIAVGDAVMYLGCEVEHGRKPFEGRYMAQVFMHFVDQDGMYNDHIEDQIKRGQMLSNLINPDTRKEIKK